MQFRKIPGVNIFITIALPDRAEVGAREVGRMGGTDTHPYAPRSATRGEGVGNTELGRASPPHRPPSTQRFPVTFLRILERFSKL